MVVISLDVSISLVLIYKQLGKNFVVFIVGADLRVCPYDG
jgi:hypothetical protein